MTALRGGGKEMKNKTMKILPFITLLSSSMMLFSCSNDPVENTSSSENAATLKISEVSLTLEKYDSYQLTYTLKGSSDFVYWTIDNEEVATVEDGLVKALSLGRATISVHAGDLISSCTLDVIAPSQAAVLYLSHEEIIIGRGEYFEVDAYATYKNIRYDVPFEVSFASSSPLDVVTYSKKESKIRIDGVKEGIAYLSVHMDAFDTSMNKQIKVEVIDL